MTQINQTRSRRIGPDVSVVDYHANTDQEVIQITEDKLRLILDDHLDCAERKHDWMAPLGLFISIVTTFCTADFRLFVGLAPDFWRALFALVGVGSIVWLVYAARVYRKAPTLDSLIARVKNKQVIP